MNKEGQLKHNLSTTVYNQSHEELRKNEVRWYRQLKKLESKMSRATKTLSKLESFINATASNMATEQQIQSLTAYVSRYVKQSKLFTKATREFDQRLQRLNIKISKNAVSGISICKLKPCEEKDLLKRLFAAAEIYVYRRHLGGKNDLPPL